MPSTLGWIDFSSEHREKVRSVIDFLSAPGVVDELGIGVIRDTFADGMFPGISTIQTRPKYFLLTALLIREFQTTERAKRKPRTFERFLEEEEKLCRIRLVEKHGAGRVSLGIIGGTFGLDSKRDVVRRPSSVYWNGLRQFGFISPPHLSLAEFGRRFSDDAQHLHALLQEAGDDRGDDADATDGGQMLRVLAPEVGLGYWGDLSIDLTPEEADFLHHRILFHQRETLLGQILAKDEAMKQVARLPVSADFSTFADLPFVSGLKSEDLRKLVQHARDFWLILEGAHIRYNCLLQEADLGTPELKEQFEQNWQEWRERIQDFPRGWDSGFLWHLVSKHGSQPKEFTRRFINAWIDETRQGASNRRRCDELVTNQERLNKGARARLRPGHEGAVRDWIGFDRLNYRLPQVRQLVIDLRRAEKQKGVGL